MTIGGWSLYCVALYLVSVAEKACPNPAVNRTSATPWFYGNHRGYGAGRLPPRWAPELGGNSMNIMQSLRPIHHEDDMEWQELVHEINERIPPLFWYGGAAFDSDPLVALLNGSFPKDVRTLLSADIFPILTDYDSKIVKAVQYIYDNFDKEDFSFHSLPDEPWFTSQLSGIEILQMIPLSLFDSNTLMRIRKEYQNFHPSATSSVVPDDKWHFVFIIAELDGRECKFVYGFIENLVFWKEVVEKYALNVEAFCALRVGGKSGSWDHTHSPNRGKLFDAIRTSKGIRPKLWIADDCLELRKIWREISPHDDGFYGNTHFFEAKWDMQ